MAARAKPAKERARNEGYFGNEQKKSPFQDYDEHALVFFNPKSGTEIALGVTSAFPDGQNPFYIEEESHEHIIFLLLAEELSPELVWFCVDNYKDKLPLFQQLDNGANTELIKFGHA